MCVLTELEMRILSELEEGYQSFPLLMNKVTNRKGTSDEIAAVQGALASLMESGLVSIEMSSIPTGFFAISEQEARREIAEISEHLTLNAETGVWKDDREIGPPYFQIPRPEVVCTDAGYQEALRILEERGMRWWQEDRP